VLANTHLAPFAPRRDANNDRTLFSTDAKSDGFHNANAIARALGSEIIFLLASRVVKSCVVEMKNSFQLSCMVREGLLGELQSC
jgi:hypothetical protein